MCYLRSPLTLARYLPAQVKCYEAMANKQKSILLTDFKIRYCQKTLIKPIYTHSVEHQ